MTKWILNVCCDHECRKRRMEEFRDAEFKFTNVRANTERRVQYLTLNEINSKEILRGQVWHDVDYCEWALLSVDLPMMDLVNSHLRRTK